MRFGILGPLAVWTADREPVAVPEAKVRALLAGLLVTPGRVVSSDRLIEDLWGDAVPARPDRALQTLVSRLRKALTAGEGHAAGAGHEPSGGRGLVVHRPPGYLLRVAGEAVDAESFLSLAGRARRTADLHERAAGFSAALSQWRGPAFADFADEPFARAAVTRLEEERLLVWEEHAETRLLLGEHGPLAGVLQELSERHPLRERLRAAQMRALYGAGRPSEALAVYQDVRRRLSDELGLEPGPELVALQRDILRQLPEVLPGAGVRAPAEAASRRAVFDVARARAARPDADGSGLGGSEVGGLGVGGSKVDPPEADRREMDRPEADRPEVGLQEMDRPEADPSEAAGPRPRTNLPVPMTGLIGRAQSVTRIRALLTAGRLVTLTGPGGVGKTRLALEVAGGEARPGNQEEVGAPGTPGDSFPDGVWLVELSGVSRSVGSGGHVGSVGVVGAIGSVGSEAAAPVLSGPPPDSVPGAAVDGLAELVAVALGIRDDARPDTLPPPTTAPRSHPLTDRLADALRDRRLLLVLDNCEHVIEAVAALARVLLRAAPGLRVLATSREPLGVAGEQLWPVAPLDVPKPGASPAEVRRSSAVRLFVARAAAVFPGFVLSDGDAEAVATICRRMDGIPLAVELAATRLRVLGVAGLAERLDDRFGLLTSGRRDAPARQQTLRAVIDWSWELLTAAERTVLSRLAIHSDGCTLEAAEALCSAGGVKPTEVMDLLARLVDRSLVVVTDEADGKGDGGTGGNDGTDPTDRLRPRYRLLESVAAYCLERLRASETAPAYGSGGTPAPAAGPVTVYERLRRDHARYYTALAERADTHLRGGDQQRWLRRMEAESANLRGALDTAAVTGDAPLARRLVRAMAWFWFLCCRLTEAKRSMAAALAIVETAVAERGTEESGAGETDAARAHVVAWHAGMTLLSGEPLDSRRGSHGPLRLYEDIDDPGGRAGPGWFLGYAATMFGAMEVGEELVRRALADFRALGDRWGVAAALSVRGVQRSVRGDLAAARSDAEASLALFGELGDGWGRLQATGVLGRLAEIQGDYRAAEAEHREGLRVAERLGLWTEASTRWSELGRIALLSGDHPRAERLHRRGRDLAVRHGDRRAQEFAEVGLALGARRQGRLDEAESGLRTWLEWNRRFDAANGAALILAELGFIAEHRGDSEAALRLHTEGLTAARATGDPRAVALALEGLAGARRLTGQHELAAGLLGTAARFRASVGAPLPPAERADVDRVTTAVRAALGEAGFAAAFERHTEPSAGPAPGAG
ncbi:BTAD domain-containing putative transcriptional regulator [Streptomyces sp. SAJ15]|uniref:AfsR/SARP family transcriptional regulator n=1 Tax=Streptomyces sp. SAJ15 TaxID=2011095 RepID=UPI00135EB891|nr:BTAD domain-containing putative transcriptional regulator [Streptomyces sp. SAJ15]TVL90285.1 AfsR family transcriptional regulator [Streptomyces sp. SAJ15]